jgi:hypothetical protein
MGYTSPSIYDITIFKRVAISSSLTESEIFNAVWEVEAMLTSIFVVGGVVLHRALMERRDKGAGDAA